MRYRSLIVVVITLSGVAFVPSAWTTWVGAQEPSAAPAAEPAATQEGTKPDGATEKPAELSAEKTAEETAATETPPPTRAATSGGAPAENTPTELAKVVDSNQQAANQQRDVSRTAGMIAGISLLIVLAYVLTRKKAQPKNG